MAEIMAVNEDLTIKLNREIDSIDAIVSGSEQIMENKDFLNLIERITHDVSFSLRHIRCYHTAHGIVEKWINKLKDLQYKENGHIIYEIAIRQFLADITLEYPVPTWCKIIYLKFILNNRKIDKVALRKILRYLFLDATDYEMQKNFLNVILDEFHQKVVYNEVKAILASFERSTYKLKKKLEEMHILTKRVVKKISLKILKKNKKYSRRVLF